MSAPARVAVVGAGVAGLAAACELAHRGLAVTLFEAADRVGGVIRSERQDGWLVEHGANSFAAPCGAAAELLARIGLADERLAPAPAARRRYLVLDGRPVALPASPLDALRSPLLSFSAKLRLLREPFVPPAGVDDESVAAFVRRRFGAEVLDRLVEPALGGIYAGRPDRLSARYALPALHALEREHGSVLRGLWRGRASRAGAGVAPMKPGRTIWSFAEGLETIPRRLAAELQERGGNIRLGARVTALYPTPAGWTVAVGDGAEGSHVVEAADHDPFAGVVFAGSADVLGELGVPGAPVEALRRAAAVPYAPVAVLALGFRREDVMHPLDGFGMLVPAVEHRSMLGAIFSSSLFPGRAPQGQALLTVFLGGAREPQLVEASTGVLVARTLADLRPLLGVHGEPTFRRHVVWPRGIPQFDLGHGRILEALDELERSCPGLAVAGNYRDGVAVGDALASGCAAAERLAAVIGAAACAPMP